MKKTLDELQINETGIVINMTTYDKNKKRLLDFGLCEGCAITIIKFAPLNDPIEFALNGYLLALRKDIAKRIFVETL